METQWTQVTHFQPTPGPWRNRPSMRFKGTLIFSGKTKHCITLTIASSVPQDRLCCTVAWDDLSSASIDSRLTTTMLSQLRGSLSGPLRHDSVLAAVECHSRIDGPVITWEINWLLVLEQICSFPGMPYLTQRYKITRENQKWYLQKKRSKIDNQEN